MLKWICLTNSFEATFEESISVSKPLDRQRLPTQFERKAAIRNKLKGNHRSWNKTTRKKKKFCLSWQYKPLVSTVKETLMEKWNHANKPLLCQIFKEPPILSYNKGSSLKGHARQSQNIKGQHTVSRRYRCAACHLLQFFTKNNLRIQKARVGVFLCPVNLS